jgi:hypothetical protein
MKQFVIGSGIDDTANGGKFIGMSRHTAGEAQMTDRAAFIAALDAGAGISALAFQGTYCGFTRADHAWLRRQVARGAIVARCSGHPFWRPVYSRPAVD